MRCQCCNKQLSDYDATRRHAITNEFLDLCGDCLSVISETTYIPHRDRPDLRISHNFDDDPIDNETES